MPIPAHQHAHVKSRGEATWWRKMPEDNDVQQFDPTAATHDELAELEPVRQVASSKRSRNVAVVVWSVTGATTRSLESGLEHDLHRRLDMPRKSRAVLPQPVRLDFEAGIGSHVPDFLQISREGTATLWDCRPIEATDDAARAKFEATARAARAVGWEYQVFTGMTATERMNRMHVNGYRISETRSKFSLRPWLTDHRAKLVAAASQPTTLGELGALDSGDGEIIASIWHLIGLGDLEVDMTEPITSLTTVAAR